VAGEEIARLVLEMESRFAREGSHQGCDHGGQQCQEGIVSAVFTVVPGFSEGGLVWEGTQRMYVGEEVVYQAVHDREGAYGFGGRLGARRGGELGERMGGIGGRRRCERLRRVDVDVDVALLYPALLLDCFGMAVRRPAAAARSLEGARDIEGGACPARGPRFIALRMLLAGARQGGGQRAAAPLLCGCCTSRRPCAGGSSWGSRRPGGDGHRAC
jgi:hypothetical protein